MDAKMLLIFLFCLSFHLVLTEDDPGDPMCYNRMYWDQTGWFCNNNKTGYYYCNYDGDLSGEMECPSGERCVCDGVCWDDDLDDKSFPTEEREVCEKIPPPKRPLPDPAIFTYRGEYEAEMEQSSGPDYTIKQKWLGEVRQDRKNGKYMKIIPKSSYFNLVLGETKYTGNLKNKTCKKSNRTFIERITGKPFWSRDMFLGGYDFSYEEEINGTVTQGWTKPGSTPYDAIEYFYVKVKDGFTLLGEYTVSEGRDWEDESFLVSSTKTIYYNTTYGVDSSHWFDLPSFC